ncbi:MAG: glycosyltransferase [Gemmatimonadota bacterium]
MPSLPTHVGLLIRSLNRGGAERQLAQLAKGIRKRGCRVTVVVFRPGGAFESDLAASGVRVVTPNKGGRWDLMGFGLRLVKLLKNEQITVLYSFLPDPNLIAVAVRPFVPSLRVVWGVRASALDFSQSSRTAAAAFHLSRLLAKYPASVVANSEAGAAYHIARGYPRTSMTVVPNGIDTDNFTPIVGAREQVRAKWGFEAYHDVFGLVGRLDPVKGHLFFLQCAAAYSKQRPNARFVCVGGGSDRLRRELQESAAARGLGDRVVWAGEATDVVAAYNGLDLTVSCSSSEGFSNVIGESMACGVPCVVTDVGDSRAIVADLGEVVPVGDLPRMVAAWDNVLARRSLSFSLACRDRVVSRFGLDKMVGATLEVILGPVP